MPAAQVSPAVQALCFLYGQEVAGGLVPQLFGTVDRSVDLSQERFHSEYYDPLELRVHVATAMSALVLLPVYLCAAAAVNRHVAFGCVLACTCPACPSALPGVAGACRPTHARPLGPMCGHPRLTRAHNPEF